MAVPTGSGTEIIHSACFEEITNSDVSLIVGVQHHIYSVISIIIRTTDVDSTLSNNNVACKIVGYDSNAGASAQNNHLFRFESMAAHSTFVFNDKFSFFGFEPSSNSASARVAQGSSTPQYLKIATEDAQHKVDVTITYIDQDWS
jgi:hypothetical protein